MTQQKRTAYRGDSRARRRRAIVNRIIFGIAVLAVGTGLFFGVRAAVRAIGNVIRDVMEDPTTEAPETRMADASTEATTEEPTTLPADFMEILARARLLAASYDYEKAIKLLETIPYYQVIADVMAALTEYEDIMTTLQEFSFSDVYHVFFHSLIYDSEVAFHRSGSYYRDAFNNTMTTVREFHEILKQMYEGGWVLVKLHDMAAFDEEGVFRAGSIMLPPGKKPFVLSIDDVSYYEYMIDCGGKNVNAFARKIVIDEEGYPRCEYVERDGTVSVGDYDVVPIIETFIAEHPDFSYRGARGCIALTGYNGILGYRTDAMYEWSDDPEWQRIYAEDWAQFGDWYRTIDREEERRQAAAVAARMEELGWEFASHTWGHINVGEKDLARIKWDNEKWQKEVNTLLGNDTDIIIFAFGSDLSDWHPYDMDNEKFAYLHEQGFHYYCNVSTYELPNTWVQYSRANEFIRMARANLDGYAMWKELTDDPGGRLDIFFDVETVFDPARPTPVIFVT